MDTLLPIFIAATVGFAHAFEADHLLAVSNIVTRRNSIWLAIKDGIAWGLGHTSTIFLVGVLIIGFKVAITEQTFHYFEAAVGLMLIVLGAFRMYFLWKNGRAQHSHLHLEDLFFWKKRNEETLQAAPYRFASASVPPAPDLLRFDTRSNNHHLAYGVGLVHGLAGSGTLVVLVMSQIPQVSGALLYLLIFGIGSIAGMLLASGVFSMPFSKKLSANTYLQIGLTLLSSLLCIGFGAQVVWENLQG
jgi:cytochrome c biogenesis protein CcdA